MHNMPLYGRYSAQRYDNTQDNSPDTRDYLIKFNIIDTKFNKFNSS